MAGRIQMRDPEPSGFICGEAQGDFTRLAAASGWEVPNHSVDLSLGFSGQSLEFWRGSADGELFALEETEQLERIVSRAHLALVVVQAIVLRCVVPPAGDKGSALGRHERGKLPLVHERIADVVI